MTKLRPAFAAALISLGLAACGGGDDAATPQAADAAAGNPLLAHAPADTPYLFATLEPLPDDVLDHFIERFQPVLDEMQEQMQQALAEREAHADSD